MYNEKGKLERKKLRIKESWKNKEAKWKKEDKEYIKLNKKN